MSCTVPCRVRDGVWCACLSVLLCAVGYPLSAPPSPWWWVGPLRLVGCHCGRAGRVVVGVAWQRKGGYCDVDLPSAC
nr:MAG TPA: hypothetical protein [Caudoviricetes sp.]